MDRELIQSWLQLPPGNWPPDHYTLLGLAPGEGDLARIEQQVHERMQRVRSYQLTHPELATDAMNCLAQALVCLTDPDAKKAYDRALFSRGRAEANGSQAPAAVSAPPETAPAPPSVPAADSVAANHGPAAPRGTEPSETVEPPFEEARFFDWQTAPPPLRQLPNLSSPPSSEFMSKETAENLVLPEFGAGDTFPDVSPAPPAESRVQAAEEDLLAQFSRLELRSKGALYYQIARTRQLLWAWEQAGKYLSRPTRLVSRPAEATDLIHHMGVIRELLPSSTLHMGEAGHPGYLVLALARQQMIVPTLQTLLPSQRQALARDWQAGYGLLRKVRQFLRQELHVVRRKRGWRHALRVVSASLRDHPGVLLLLAALVAVNIADRDIRSLWVQQLICLVGLGAIRLAIWLYSVQPLRIPSAPPSERRTRLSRRTPRAQRQPNSSRA